MSILNNCFKTVNHSNAAAIFSKVGRDFKPLHKGTWALVRFVSLLPQEAQRQFICPLLNRALQPLINVGELDFLQDRCCEISLTDINSNWFIGFDGAALLLLDEQKPDVCISSSSHGFLSLIAKIKDPDSLFFERILSIEGDTALGLHIKNLLDSVDEDELGVGLRKALLILRRGLALEVDAAVATAM